MKISIFRSLRLNLFFPVLCGALLWGTGAPAQSAGIAEASVVADESDRIIVVPDSFQPGSEGVTQRLTVYGRKGVRVLSFMVYNRWGQMFHQAFDFEAGDSASGWDGMLNGNSAPGGFYIWVCEVQHIDGSIEKRTGNTALIR